MPIFVNFNDKSGNTNITVRLRNLLFLSFYSFALKVRNQVDAMRFICILENEELADFAEKKSSFKISHRINLKKTTLPIVSRPKSEKNIEVDGVFYEFCGSNAYNAVQYLMHQEDFRADKGNFF